jgi:hypothetical protein
MNYSFPRSSRRLVVMTALLLVLLSQSIALMAQTGAGTLSGEVLSGPANNPATFNVTSLNCVANGVSSFNFTSQGIATGPYPGTYVESGSITFDNNLTPGAPRPILSFSSTFTITSGVTVITGTKDVAPSPAPPFANNGVCQSLPNGPLTVDSLTVNFAATYTATIPVGPGEFVNEQGTSRVFGSAFRAHTTNPDGSTNTVAQTYSFNETFLNPAAIARVTLTPPTATNPVGSSHTVTATATSATGAPIPNVRVLFTVTPGDDSALITDSCITGANGQCTFTYQGPEFPRTDAIRGCADSNRNGAIEPTEPCGIATKEFVFPVSTPGHITGGGQILDAQTGVDGISFGFNFKSDGTNLQGNCTVNDKARNTMVKCVEVLVFVQDGNHATAYGTAEVNGVETLFKIDVFDNGQSGAGQDVFTIITQSGYTAGGLLTQGNIQIH